MPQIGSLDIESLVSRLINEKLKLKVDPLRKLKQLKEATSQALTNLKSEFEKLSTSVDAFKSANGNVIEKKATSSNQNILTVSTSTMAQVGSYSIQVTQLASGGQATSGGYTSKESALFPTLDDNLPASSRTLSITIGTGSNASTYSIILDSSDTLESVRNKLANIIPSSKAAIQIINTGTESNPNYRLSILATNTGVDLGTVQISGGSAPEIQSFISNFSIQSAQNAVFIINGNQFERSSNSISDAIQGVSINLISTGSSIVNISNDVSKTIEKIRNFISAYNSVVDKISEGNQINVNKENAAGPLRETRADELAFTSIRMKIFDTTITEGSNSFNLSYFGISTSRDGKLGLDESRISYLINNEPERVDAIFKKLGDEAGNIVTGIKQFFNSSSPFASSINNLNEEIRNLDDRIKKELSNLKEEENMLRASFSKITKIQDNLNRALSVLSKITNPLF